MLHQPPSVAGCIHHCTLENRDSKQGLFNSEVLGLTDLYCRWIYFLGDNILQGYDLFFLLSTNISPLQQDFEGGLKSAGKDSTGWVCWSGWQGAESPLMGSAWHWANKRA